MPKTKPARVGNFGINQQPHKLSRHPILARRDMPQTAQYNLNFCTIFHRKDGIAIIKINEGVEVNAGMAKEVSELAAKVIKGAPFALLSDRKNSYSLSFEAMSNLANIPNLVALAIVIYSDRSRLLVETQNFFISAMKKRPVKIFTDKEPALEWLRTELDKVIA